LPAETLSMLITCEHGGNLVPRRFAPLFRGRNNLLESHRGYDAGALALARKLAGGLKADLFFSRVTRLLVDLNRSPGNPRRFSEATRRLPVDERAAIEHLYYEPYREQVQAALLRAIGKQGKVVHISVHTFVPAMGNKMRVADIGFLYDPSRKNEAAFCMSWQKTLRQLNPDLKTRRNYPYRGISDGFISHMRTLLPQNSYLGIELEVNQKFPLGDRVRWLKLKQALLNSLVITSRSI
jgi:predicted N-formylglutamate amidohydrolase